MLTGRQMVVITAVLGVAGAGLPIVAARAYDGEHAWAVLERTASLAWGGWPFRVAAAVFACAGVVALALALLERATSGAAERRARAARRVSRPPPRPSAPPPIDGAAPPARLAALGARVATQRPLTIDAPTIDNLGLSAAARRRLDELLLSRGGVVLVVCRDRLIGTQAARVIDGLRTVGRAMVVFADVEASRTAVEGAASRTVVVAVHGRSAEGVLRELRSRAPVLREATRGVVEVTMFPRLCGMCTHPRLVDLELRKRADRMGLDMTDRSAYRGEGCDVCKGSGKRGGAYVSIVSPPDEAIASTNRSEELLEWIEKGWLGVDDVVEGLALHAS